MIIILGILSAVGYGAFLYYKDTQTRIAVLTSNNAKLKTAHDQTIVEFDQYRNNVKEEIKNFKAKLEKQQKLNDELSINLKNVQESNKAISKLLANTDIIKNSLADPKATEGKINEQVDLFFGAIDCASNTECVQSLPSP
jgi:Tfp pilus assembly protein PilO